MGQHPIEELMKTAMESIKEMVDVNTIVGDAVQTVDGTVIIPVSKVAFGFAAGGGEFSNNKRAETNAFPFAGGSGAGVSINPVAFMIVGRNNTIKMIPASPHAALDRALDNIPQIIEQLKKAFEPGSRKEKEQKHHEKTEEDKPSVEKLNLKASEEDDE
ncbi:MAG: sporulation protein YtfJ [Clostridiaceae bacterium]|nr:sporulation protein YtfJ [Clostridiaceae bacterium]